MNPLFLSHIQLWKKIILNHRYHIWKTWKCIKVIQMSKLKLYSLDKAFDSIQSNKDFLLHTRQWKKLLFCQYFGSLDMRFTITPFWICVMCPHYSPVICPVMCPHVSLFPWHPWLSMICCISEVVGSNDRHTNWELQWHSGCSGTKYCADGKRKTYVYPVMQKAHLSVDKKLTTNP